MSNPSPLAMLSQLFSAVDAKIAAIKRAKVIAAKIAETFGNRESAADVQAVLDGMRKKAAADAAPKVKAAAKTAAARANGALSAFKTAAADLPLSHYLPTVDGVMTVRAIVESAIVSAESASEAAAEELQWLTDGKASSERLELAQDKLDNAVKKLLKLRARIEAADTAAAAAVASSASTSTAKGSKGSKVA